MNVYLGIDVGSVNTKFAVLDERDQMVVGLDRPTAGNPITAVQAGLREVEDSLPSAAVVCGVATTGSARYLIGGILNADMVKNEITCHALAALRFNPAVRTVIEIGGQDSKIIIIRDGLVADFGLNTVCAAGTGSFLERQAQRLALSLDEFGETALQSRHPAAVTGRCAVFAESDMVSKQQRGYKLADIVYGLCRALVRNYLSDVGAGKIIEAPVVFQGGVACNRAIVRAFEEELHTELCVPPDAALMGAVGAALLMREEAEHSRQASRFKGFRVAREEFGITSFECQKCLNRCEVAELSAGGRKVSRWGGKCDLWETISG